MFTDAGARRVRYRALQSFNPSPFQILPILKLNSNASVAQSESPSVDDYRVNPRLGIQWIVQFSKVEVKPINSLSFTCPSLDLSKVPARVRYGGLFRECRPTGIPLPCKDADVHSTHQ